MAQDFMVDYMSKTKDMEDKYLLDDTNVHIASYTIINAKEFNKSTSE